jgi:FKBP12-rapamycin complex-associated protein
MDAAAIQALAAAAAQGCEDSEEEDEDEDDGPAGASKVFAGLQLATDAEGGAFVTVSAVPVAAAPGEGQSALSTLDFSSTEPAGTHLQAAAAETAAAANVGATAAANAAAQQAKQVAGSLKSVSFASTQQTLQSDNTIRNSSIRMEILPAGATQALPNVSTNASDFTARSATNNPVNTNGAGLAGVSEIEVVDQYDAAARTINARTASTTAAAAEGIAVFGSAPGSGSAFAAPTSSFRPNLHLEMSTMANSVTMQSPSGTAMDGNSSFAHSLSQSRMSVRNSSSLRAAPGSSRAEALVASVADAIAAQEVGGSASGGDLNDLQQELTEKAVVVIRRVMDKLTGLDFADSTGQQHALEVSDQVDRLIREATSNENLSQSFFGWCPFW